MQVEPHQPLHYKNVRKWSSSDSISFLLFLFLFFKECEDNEAFTWIELGGHECHRWQIFMLRNEWDWLAITSCQNFLTIVDP